MNHPSSSGDDPAGQGASSTEMQLFGNGEFELQIDYIGDSFIVRAPGLARALGFRDASNMLASVPAGEKGYFLSSTPDGSKQVTEAGFYRLIGKRQATRIKSAETREQVERFQDWVFGDVLPSIRRTGGYGKPVTARPADLDLSDPLAELEHLNGKLGQAIAIAKQERDGRMVAEAKFKALEPVVAEIEQHRAKAEYVDVFVDGRQDVTGFRVYCTQIDVPERKFREHLIAKGIIYRKPICRRWSRSQGVYVVDHEYHPRADYKKWFHVKDQPEAPRHHNNQVRTTLYVTPLGKVKLQDWLGRHPLGGAA